MSNECKTCLDMSGLELKTLEDQLSLSFEDQEPIREGRPFMLAERSFLQKQAADSVGSIEIEFNGQNM